MPSAEHSHPERVERAWLHDPVAARWLSLYLFEDEPALDRFLGSGVLDHPLLGACRIETARYELDESLSRITRGLPGPAR